MLRVQISSSSTGVSPYTFITNPSDYDPVNKIYQDSITILNGAPVWQSPMWDGRERTLKWNLLTTSSAYSVFISTVLGWQGSVKYINFRDINILNLSWPSTALWKKCRIIDIYTEPRSGGTLLYSLTVVLQPER